MEKVNEGAPTQYLGYLLAAVFIVLSLATIIIKYTITKTLAEIEKLKAKVSELDVSAQLMAQKLLNTASDVSHLKAIVEASNAGIAKLNETLIMFDGNMKFWHKDIVTQNAEIKIVMDRSNVLIGESTKINVELMGVLKDMKK